MKKTITLLALAATIGALAAAGGTAPPASAVNAFSLFVLFDGDADDLWEWLGGDPETGEYIGEVDPWGIPGRIGPCPAYEQDVCGDDGSGETVQGGETVILTWGGVTYRVHFRTNQHVPVPGVDYDPASQYSDGSPLPSHEPVDYVQCPGGDSPDYDPNNEACWRAAP